MATPTEALQTITRFKYFQAELYRRALSTFATGGQAFTPGELAVVQQVHKQKTAHVAQLRTALGASAPVQPAAGTVYDMSAGSGSGTGPFANAVGGATPTKVEFFKLAQLVEDFNIRCAKGRFPDLMSAAASLRLAVQMHGVDGRHAGIMRMMRGGVNRTKVTRATTAFTTAVFPWIGNTATTLYDTAAGGFTGVESNTNSQAFVATLVYGVYYTGADRFTRVQDTEANNNQRGYSPMLHETCDEPMAMAGVDVVFGRFNI